jgi:hypothetical protein
VFEREGDVGDGSAVGHAGNLAGAVARGKDEQLPLRLRHGLDQGRHRGFGRSGDCSVDIKVRRTYAMTEERHEEAGRMAAQPLRRVAAGRSTCLIENCPSGRRTKVPPSRKLAVWCRR